MVAVLAEIEKDLDPVKSSVGIYCFLMLGVEFKVLFTIICSRTIVRTATRATL
jgi:hypothetical protein